MDTIIIWMAGAVVLASAWMLLRKVLIIRKNLRRMYQQPKPERPDDTGDEPDVERPDDTGELCTYK